MSSAARSKKINQLAAKPVESQPVSPNFEPERMAFRALMTARQENDFERMAQLVASLNKARQARLNKALGVGKVTVIEESITPETTIKPGCYLVRPPQVGADARRLRLAAFDQGVPVAVLCHEPLTKTKLTPVVAVGAAAIMRTKVPTPQNPAKPDLIWFAAAMSELGDAAIESLDPEMAPIRQVDALLDMLEALPEHENLHVALTEACAEARKQRDQAQRSKAAAAKAKPQPGEQDKLGEDREPDSDDERDPDLV